MNKLSKCGMWLMITTSVAPHSMRAIRNNRWAAPDKNNFSPNNGNSESTDNNAMNVQTYGDGVTGCQWPRLLLRQEPHR